MGKGYAAKETASYLGKDLWAEEMATNLGEGLDVYTFSPSPADWAPVAIWACPNKGKMN